MHVGLFTESYPPIINGVSTSVVTLTAELERAGHRVSVFTSRVSGYKDEREGVYRYPSVKALVERDYVLPIPFSVTLARQIPRLGLDIVHSHSPFLLGLLARRVARGLGVPLVSTNHTLYLDYAHYVPLVPTAFTRRALLRLMRWYYNECDQVIAPSELTRRCLRDTYGVHVPVEVIPTGIPSPPYLLARPADTRRELGLEPSARLLLYVGRLAPEKNLGTLLRAFQTVAARVPDTFLVLAGSGASLSALQRLCRALDIQKRVVFTGFLGRTRLDPLYEAADLFLFPSKTETQGLAVGEALAAGTPCVVVNGGGAPEAIREGENGLVVADAPDALAGAALRLLEDDALRRRLAANARAGAMQMTPERVAGRVIALYESLLQTRSSAPPLRSAPPPQI